MTQNNKKKLLFSALTTVAFFGCLEVTLALVGVRPVLYTEDPYVGFSDYAPLFTEERDADGKVWMATAPNKLAWFNEQRFPAKKESGVNRIFCLGGSTTYGRPYDDTTSFCGWLREMLVEAQPSRRWEVINAGGVSYASYRVARVMEELLQYEPDLFIIYCGHNEFLERRTYQDVIETPSAFRNLGGLASRTRTFALVKRAFEAAQHESRAASDRSKRHQLPEEVAAVLDRSVGPSSYTRDDQWQRQVVGHYKFNLRRMTAMARSAGAGVVLVSPASNLRDFSPFKSERRAGLTDTQLQKWQTRFHQGAEASRQGQWEEALEAFDAAATIDGRYAHLHFLRGKALWELKRFDEAKAAFLRARDEDVCPLRAVTSIEKIVAETANREQAPLVDFVGLAAAWSEQGVPGANLFLDHVHPTIKVNQLLALAILDAMAIEGLLRPSPSWGEASVKKVAKRIESRLDQRAHGAALLNLSKVLGWAGKAEESSRLALKAVKLLPEDAEAQYQAGNALFSQGNLEGAGACYRRALSINPRSCPYHYGAGLVFHEQGQLGQAESEYRKSIALDPKFVPAHYNLARVYEALGELSQAARHYQRALEIDPGQLEAYNNLGRVFAQQQKWKQAEDCFRAALRIDPQYEPARANLALVLEDRAKVERSR